MDNGNNDAARTYTIRRQGQTKGGHVKKCTLQGARDQASLTLRMLPKGTTMEICTRSQNGCEVVYTVVASLTGGWR